MQQVYMAGPLFNEGERWFDEQLDALVRELGFKTFLPHRDGKEGKMKNAHNIPLIFAEDVHAIEESSIIVANLNGLLVDDGTAWEIGYAYARGKHIVGVRTDWRLSFPHQAVNLMIECSLHKLVRSTNELREYLLSWPTGSPD